MKTESEVKTDSVKRARKAGWYARRFEDQYAVGLPDTYYAKNGKSIFIEWKIIRSDKFSPSPRQAIELKCIASAGIQAGVAGYDMETKRVYWYLLGDPDGVTITPYNQFLQALGEVLQCHDK